MSDATRVRCLPATVRGPDPVRGIMFCARCGNQVPEGDRVCTRCGANLLELFAVRNTPFEPGAAPAPASPAPTTASPAPGSPRLSDSQVWDRFMRPVASGTGSAAPDTDTGTRRLPQLDDVTRQLPGTAGPGASASTAPPADRTRIMQPVEPAPTRAPGGPTDAATPARVTGPVTAGADATVDDLPPEWFRGAAPVDPPTGPTRPGSGASADSGGTQRPGAPIGSMIEPAPGRPPAPGQRRRHERLSAAGVAALVCVPVALLAVFVGRYLSQHHGAQEVPAVVTASATAPAATTTTTTTTTKTASASAGAPAGVPVNATRCTTTVWAGSGTSCAFARVVAAAATANSAEDFQVTATSPVTGIRYTMDCSRTLGLDTCTGGRAAAVYVRVG